MGDPCRQKRSNAHFVIQAEAVRFGVSAKRAVPRLRPQRNCEWNQNVLVAIEFQTSFIIDIQF